MPERSSTYLALVAVALVAGAAGAFFATWGESSGESTGDAAIAGRVASLEQALAAESRARSGLADELEALRGQLELMAAILADADGPREVASVPPRPPSADTTAGDAGAGTAPSASDAEEGDTEADGPPLPGTPWFDAEGLSALGLREQDIERLRARWEQYELDKLYIQDEAARGGGRRMSVQQREELDARMRGELGESEYDLLLYASGQPNRVRVLDVLESSPGGVAGLERGDLILSYAGGRIFGPRDLRDAIASAPRGDLVWVEVRSGDGSERFVQIPAGPIGIKMMPDRVAPEP